MTTELFDLRREKMGQAKTLTDQELKRVLNFVACQKHAKRNRAMLLVTHWSGMRVGEVAALRIGDVWSAESGVKDEVRLLSEQTKGKHPRSVFIPQKLRRELAAYLATIDRTDISKPLFSTQKRDHFTAIRRASIFTGSKAGGDCWREQSQRRRTLIQHWQTRAGAGAC
jgi:integrase